MKIEIVLIQFWEINNDKGNRWASKLMEVGFHSLYT